ncbi:porin family protein [Aquimarina rhabdastrellae]
MKKITFFALFMVLGLVSMNAQEDIRFGVTAGYANATAKLKAGNIDESEGSSGFFLGALAEFKLNEKFSIEPKLTFTQISEDGNKTDFLQLPVMAKFYPVSDSGFNLQAGPQITYTLEDISDDFTKFNIALGAGVGYEFLDNFFVDARYHLQLNNYYTGSGSDDIKSRVNFLNIGIGYKF